MFKIKLNSFTNGIKKGWCRVVGKIFPFSSLPSPPLLLSFPPSLPFLPTPSPPSPLLHPFPSPIPSPHFSSIPLLPSPLLHLLSFYCSTSPQNSLKIHPFYNISVQFKHSHYFTLKSAVNAKAKVSSAKSLQFSRFILH